MWKYCPILHREDIREMKKLLALVLCATMTLSLAGCGEKATEDVAVTTTTEEPTAEETTVEETAEQPEEEVEEEPVEEVEEPVEETTTEEPKGEMVDFETWAKQEGNDEVCLVVWNEELGIQEIVPTLQETEEKYQIQDGDRFAIPYNEKIIDVKINKETGIFSNFEYLELPLTKGEINMVNIYFENGEGEHETINYVFK